jgi:hypothetical protein
MATTDDFEVGALPDLEGLRAQGLVPITADESEIVGITAADQECYDAARPDLDPAFEVAVRWIETEVRPLRDTAEGRPLADEAAACTRTALPGHDDLLTDVDSILGLATEVQLSLQGEALRTRSLELAEVFATCSGPYYAWQAEVLRARRPAAEAANAAVVASVTEIFAEIGYPP